MRLARIALRVPAVALLLLAGLLIQGLLFGAMTPATRERTTARWSRALLACCGLSVRLLRGPAAPALETQRGVLLLCNHVSWLDIFVIDAIAPSRFVAKDDIRRWPLIGALCAGNGTLFIDRGRRHAVHAMLQQMAQALADGDRVAVFPEGTTSEGHTLLPFHANLVQAAIAAQAPVLPVVLRYRDARGEHASAVEFVGDDTFVTSLWRVLGARGLVVELHVLALLAHEPGQTRHALTERAHARMLAVFDEAPGDTA